MLLELADVPQRVLLELPLGLHAAGLLAQLRKLLLDHVTTLDRRLVLLLGERLPLDLELHDATLDLVDLLRQRIDLDTQPRRGLVHEVDRLVWEEPVADVPIGERGRRDECAVGDAHAMVRLVALLEAAQDRDRALDRRLADEDGLEAALEGRVLLDVLAVLVKRGRTDHAQFAARQHRLEHVAGIHRALGLAGADDRVEFVDEHHELPRARGDFLEHGLEALLELAAELGAGDECAEVERHELLVAERLRYVAVHDALGETLGDRGLAHARLTDEDRVVLGATREDLHHATDLLVATDHRVELALPRVLGEVARVLRQRLILILWRLVGDLVRAAHDLERLEQTLLRDALGLEEIGRLGALHVGEGDQQVFYRYVLVPERLGLLLGLIEHGGELASEARLRVALLGVSRDLALERLAEWRDGHTHLLQDRHDDAVVLCEQGDEEVRVVDQRVAVPTRVADRFGQGFLGLYGQAIGGEHSRGRCEVGGGRWEVRFIPRALISSCDANGTPYSLRRFGGVGVGTGASVGLCGGTSGILRYGPKGAAVVAAKRDALAIAPLEERDQPLAGDAQGVAELGR